MDWPTDPGSVSVIDLRSLTMSAGHSQASPAPMGVAQEQSGADRIDITIRRGVPPDAVMEYSPVTPYPWIDESQTTPVEMLLLGGVSAVTPPLSPPTVPSTPYPANVPMVQGTPLTPIHPPPGQAALQPAAPSAAQPMPMVQRLPEITERAHPPQAHHHPGPGTLQRQHAPMPGQHTGKRHVHQRAPKLHRHRPHVRRIAVGLFSNPQWRSILLIVFAVFVFGTIAVLFVLPRAPKPPVLTLSARGDITPGSVVGLRGSGFVPNENVLLTLDKGLPLTLNAHATPGIASSDAFGDSLGAVALLGMPGAMDVQQAGTVSNQVKVDNSGGFFVSFVVNESLQAGSHTIHAVESPGSRSADMQFTVKPVPAKLSVSPFVLDYGKLVQGAKAVLSVVVTNTGQSRMSWTADSGNTPWLKLQSKAGAIELSGSQEFVYVTADTANLNAGAYTAGLRITSNGGDELVSVKLQVVPAGALKQPKLDVNPNSLDFGQLPQNQQRTLNVAIGNTGMEALHWKADTGKASWLTLNQASGTVQPGDQPPTMQVTANTNGLAVGSYTATITINSDGGKTQVAVTLVVTKPAPPPPPVLVANTNGFSTPADPNCSYNTSAGWTCTVVLSSYQSAQEDLNWTASSNGSSLSGVHFAPAKDTLAPGRAEKVTISIPNMVCPAQGDFLFAGPANIVDLVWNCGISPWVVSPGSFHAQTDCPYTASAGWTCSETLSEGNGAEGELSWSTSSTGLNGITFTPAGGILSPTQPMVVTIAVPNIACPTSAIFTFSARGENAVPVPWGCGMPATLTADPTSFTGGSNCPWNKNGWTCTVTLAPAAGSQGNLSWSVTTGLPGVQITPSSGILTPNQSVEVVISIPNADCVSDTFTFVGPGNAVPIPWSCRPPTLTVTPTSLTAGSDCAVTSYADGWTCQATLAPVPGASGNLTWSAISDLTGVTFTPLGGTLAPGGSVPVSIFVPISACMSGSFSFSGPVNAVPVSWSCTPPKLKVSTSPFNANTDCTYNNGWSCTETLSLGARGSSLLNWSASGSNGATFSPGSGTLSGNQPVQVSVFVPPTSCPGSADLSFAGQGSNTANVSWSCVASTLNTSPDSSHAPGSQCAYTAPGSSGAAGWTCTETLSLDGQSNAGDPPLQWLGTGSIGSDSLHYNPSSGTLSGTQVTQVTVNIPNTVCPTSTDITFQVTGGNALNVPWSCGAPALTIDTNIFNNSSCPQNSDGSWTCTETVMEPSSAQGDLSWSVSASSSLPNVGFSPASGMLTPGNSAPVSITIPADDCTGGSFDFAVSGSNGNPVSATWNCMVPTPTPTPSPSPSPTPTNTPTATPTDTPTVTPSVTPTDTPTMTPSVTPTDTPTVTPSVTPTDTPTMTPSVTPTDTPPPSPTPPPPPPTPTDTPTPPPPTPSPTATPPPPTPSPTATPPPPTPSPTATPPPPPPTPSPTATPPPPTPTPSPTATSQPPTPTSTPTPTPTARLEYMVRLRERYGMEE